MLEDVTIQMKNECIHSIIHLTFAGDKELVVYQMELANDKNVSTLSLNTTTNSDELTI